MSIIINTVDFDTENISAAAQFITISFDGAQEEIEGATDETLEAQGSEFINLQIFDNSSPNKFYNFETNTFTSGMDQSSKNKIVHLGDVIKINIPASTSKVYNVLAFLPSDTKMKFDRSVSSSDNIFASSVTQVANTVLTLTPATSNSSTYKSFTSLTRTAAQTASETNLPFSFTIENVDTDANGFGLVPTLNADGAINFIDNNFYFETTQTVNGAVSSGTNVVLDGLTDIVQGMVITGVSSGSLSGTPTILSIGQTEDASEILNPNTIVLSSAQTFADGITLTFRAKGSRLINEVLGTNISFTNLVATPTVLTKTVRSAVSNSTTITLNGTYSVAKGSFFKGLDVDNSSANAVQSVSASSTAGSMVCQVNQTLVAGAILTFKGCHEIITLTGNINITTHPKTNRTININLDDLMTPGVGS